MTIAPPPDTPHIPPPYRPPPPEDVRTIHLDEAIIVADKPAGLLSVPGIGPEKQVCVQSILETRHGVALTVHRLDMDTSGVMVFARTKDAQRYLSRGFERRLVTKQYEAIVEGDIAEDTGTISLPIARYSLRRPFRHIDPDGQEAITDWQVLARMPTTTRLRLSPKTGRTHQLRLHLSAIGHPILGDDLYGNKTSANRLLLHATALSFPNPIDSKPIYFSAPALF